MTASALKKIPVLILLAALGLSGCGLDHWPAVPTPTATPTATSVPLAVSVNGEGITAPDFEAELARYQQAQTGLGNTVNLEDATQVVLNDLIDQLLLEQGAVMYGQIIDDVVVQARIDGLAEQVGDPDALAAWELQYGYTDAAFRNSLRRSIAAGWMRDQIIASVPDTAEQVHVKQILRYTAEEAQNVLEQLQAGADFTDLASTYDPITLGELGWFPRGYLPEMAIEEAAFALQPGQYSDVVQTGVGYHLLMVVAYDPARRLSPDALLTLQERAVQDWLTRRRSESTILFAP